MIASLRDFDRAEAGPPRATDRQRLIVREVLEAAWVMQVVQAAEHALRQGPGRVVTLITPDFRAYDNAEAALVRLESGR